MRQVASSWIRGYAAGCFVLDSWVCGRLLRLGFVGMRQVASSFLLAMTVQLMNDCWQLLFFQLTNVTQNTVIASGAKQPAQVERIIKEER
jgi:hypothetical protein